MVTFVSRAITFPSPSGPPTKIWRSRCRRYRVRYSHPTGLAARYYAQVRLSSGHIVWDVISHHLSKQAAIKACLKHDKENQCAGRKF